ncbi:MAG TPA: nuclear transport factor 2 family protein [Mucilaginibacter sp.]|nr:nuclear transport factor 2 family protein [Mucilaginibacter sp.]
MIKNFLFFIFLTVSQLAFAQNNRDADIIKASRLASNAAIARHDIDGMAKYWLPDFVQTIGRGTSLTGKEVIIASWKQLFKSNLTVLYIRHPVAITVGDNGIMAWETGTWEAKNSYSKGGNYSAMWRKINGEWKLQAELFVSLRKL